MSVFGWILFRPSPSHSTTAGTDILEYLQLEPNKPEQDSVKSPDSNTDSLIWWMKEEWIKVMNKRFTDSNTDSLKERKESWSLPKDSRTQTVIRWKTGTNQGHDRSIHWLKHWFIEWKRSESWSWPKDSLTQTLIHWNRGTNQVHEQRIHLLKHWFAELCNWRKQWMNLTESVNQSDSSH